MSSTSLIRWSGAALSLGGILGAVAFAFHPLVPELPMMAGARWLLPHALTGVAFLIIMPGLAGLYLYLAEKSGLLGLLAYSLASIGCALMAGLLFFIETIVLPVAASNPVYAVLADPTGEVYQGTLTLPVFLATLLIFALGFGLLGIAVVRAGNLPRVAGYMIAVGGVLGGLDFPTLPKIICMAGIILVGLGLAQVGFVLWRATNRVTVGSEVAMGVSS